MLVDNTNYFQKDIFCSVFWMIYFITRKIENKLNIIAKQNARGADIYLALISK